jgi:hypothetical protein
MIRTPSANCYVITNHENKRCIHLPERTNTRMTNYNRNVLQSSDEHIDTFIAMYNNHRMYQT